MSVAAKQRIQGADKPAASLASKLMQGTQPKHSLSNTSVGSAMSQAGKYPGSKGSEWKSLGRALSQSAK